MKMCAPLIRNRKNDTGSRKLKLNVKISSVCGSAWQRVVCVMWAVRLSNLVHWLCNNSNNSNNTFCIIHIIFAYALRFCGPLRRLTISVTYLTLRLFSPLNFLTILGFFRALFFVEINNKKALAKGIFSLFLLLLFSRCFFINQKSCAALSKAHLHSIGVARRTDRVPNWQKIAIDQCGAKWRERGGTGEWAYVANWVIRPADKVAKSQLQFEIDRERERENKRKLEYANCL